MMPLLSIENLSVNYGAIPALRDVNLEIAAGETLAIVGANGAGKSTLTLAVLGVIAIRAGSVRFGGELLGGYSTEDIARMGLSLVPEGRHIFEGLTVEENLKIGTTARNGQASKQWTLPEVYRKFPLLESRKHGLATRLSGGEQQQLAIARALVSGPKVLILDEPSLGLSPVMVDRVYEILKDLKRQGITILLIEQNPSRIGEVADRVAILSQGSVVKCGPVSEVISGVSLETVYLGMPS